MREVVQTSQFKQDLKKIKHSGRYKIDDLLAVVESLASNKPLPVKNQAHDLTGHWQTYKECHIKPDWLLIYHLPDDKLILVRTGSHSELF
ncbi:MAG: type II toxin-antitoxin system YafQ family toxin [Methylobacter sp.]|nr:type II toxin-antitoxin system YafQ family toxin [Methylobacter sp.]MDP1663657.1 type II toxin-antitoxin system YafQ family toxin [Methylobacter sp.]MDP1970406.1 type II toxin-antitoxin system YafQ family toxin [Methylobacter sp.]